MKCEIMSPDGFPITRNRSFTSIKAAVEFYKKWKETYVKQGYYLDCNRRKLSPDVLDNNCYLIKYKGKDNPVSTHRVAELIKS
jgi:hypothetical protein